MRTEEEEERGQVQEDAGGKKGGGREGFAGALSPRRIFAGGEEGRKEGREEETRFCTAVKTRHGAEY